MSASEQEVESLEKAELREEVRAWIDANRPSKPEFLEPENFMFVETNQQFEYLLDWQRKLYEAGYLGMEWPREYGGGGAPGGFQNVVARELSRAGTPALVNIIGLQWAGPVILRYGTEGQKQRLLKPMLSGEEIWCQGFSEPGSGSDLASASTFAESAGEGKGWTVNGHKVWTTLGRFSKWMILLARTDKAAPQYDGLSFFLFPMDVSGVQVLPLVKITGEGGFNQVIFGDSPMPQEALLGKLGRNKEGLGWMRASSRRREALASPSWFLRSCSASATASTGTTSQPSPTSPLRRSRRAAACGWARCTCWDTPPSYSPSVWRSSPSATPSLIGWMPRWVRSSGGRCC